ncbi:hypothetical protein [Streptacidiphilus rugosus]|uniref:hypothetical protein n=1 Tax=Streptacidiphilus rugosus TaxID=405783 RepID=UPI000A8D127F|nr:hypothetical protein [Streptacidiphilus rugosus]
MTPTQDDAAAPQAADPVVDRAVWLRLRDVARRGQLEWEGAALVDELHELYPAWREEW